MGGRVAASAVGSGASVIAMGVTVLVALVVAALVPLARPPVLVALAVGVVATPRGSAIAWSCAGGLPVALVLAWSGLVGDLARGDLLDCANLASPAAVMRVVEVVTVLAVVVLLARRLGVPVRSLGFRRPTRTETALGLLAVAVIPAASLLLGGLLAEPFFGPVRLHLAEPMAIVPAVALAVANGTMEEVAYRGALMSWLAPVVGPVAALVGQAVVFGTAHTGPDYVASALPVVLVVTAGGLAAGLIVRRTGSLSLPIVVHACLDVPLYYAMACRIA